MAYPPKIKQALDVLATTGISRWNYAPPLHRLLWSLGVPIRPPLFNSFAYNFLSMGSSFGVAFTWLTRDQDSTLVGLLAQCVITGGAFGLIMAIWMQRRARRYNLPAWSEIDDVAKRFD